MQSEQYFDTVLKTDPADSNALYSKAMCLISQNKLDSAIICLEKIDEGDSLYTLAQFQKSKIHKLQGNIKQSLEILSKVSSSEVFKFLIDNDIVFDDIKQTKPIQKMLEK